MPHLVAGHLVAVGVAEALGARAYDPALPFDLGADRFELTAAHDDAPAEAPPRGAGDPFPIARPDSSTSAIANSNSPSSASKLIRSVGSWLCSVPSARFRQANPAARKALASEAPPVLMCVGSYPHARSACSATVTSNAFARVRKPWIMRSTVMSRSH